MFERYTERARRVLFFARYEASQLGHRSIETEHLLLGLLREGKGITSKIFDRARLSFDDVHLEVEKRRPPVEKLATSVEIPFTAEAKRVLHYAAEEADRLLHNYIGTEHLLLGLLREERSVAWSILNAAGLKVNAVRDDIVMLLNQFPHGHADEDSEGGDGTGMAAFATEFSTPALKLAGYTTSGHELHRNVLFDQLFDALPKDPQAKVQIYNAEIAPAKPNFRRGFSSGRRPVTCILNRSDNSIAATIRIRPLHTSASASASRLRTRITSRTSQSGPGERQGTSPPRSPVRDRHRRCPRGFRDRHSWRTAAG